MPHSRNLRFLGVATAVVLAAFMVPSFGTAPAGATSTGANGRIAFVRLTQETGPHIYSINSNGTSIKELMPDAAEPAWSTDGSMLAFTSGLSGAKAIWLMNADRSGLRQLTYPIRGKTWDGNPTWSPDNSTIAFTRDRPNGQGIFRTNIWLVNTDGTGLRKLTTDNLADDPDWAPRGAQIAFTDYSLPTRITSNIAVINANGTGLHGVGGGPSMDYTGPADPSWSPNGRWIAFVMSHRGSYTDDIWKMTADGTKMEALTHKQAADDRSPAWSPDGTMIAFTSDRSGYYKIWTIGANGFGVHQVTWLGTVMDLMPNWRPIPR